MKCAQEKKKALVKQNGSHPYVGVGSGTRMGSCSSRQREGGGLKHFWLLLGDCYLSFAQQCASRTACGSPPPPMQTRGVPKYADEVRKSAATKERLLQMRRRRREGREMFVESPMPWPKTLDTTVSMLHSIFFHALIVQVTKTSFVFFAVVARAGCVRAGLAILSGSTTKIVQRCHIFLKLFFMAFVFFFTFICQCP